MPTTTVPARDVELFTDEALADPFPAYKEIRDAGRPSTSAGTTSSRSAGTPRCARR